MLGVQINDSIVPVSGSIDRRTISKDDREIMLNIDAIYEEWRTTTKQEGREEADRVNITRMLVAKFGAIDPELVEVGLR
jgi:hypothetical protein